MVYPHHGAGKIMKIEQKDVLGQQRDYLTIQTATTTWTFGDYLVAVRDAVSVPGCAR